MGGETLRLPSVSSTLASKSPATFCRQYGAGDKKSTATNCTTRASASTTVDHCARYKFLLLYYYCIVDFDASVDRPLCCLSISEHNRHGPPAMTL